MSPVLLDGARVALARPNAHDLLEIKYKNLPVPNLAGFRRFHDRFDHQFNEPIIHRDLDFCLRHKLNHILGAAINLGVSPLPAETPHLGDCQPANPDIADRSSYLVELERFDDRGDELHANWGPSG